jgi:hypothetical protein
MASDKKPKLTPTVDNPLFASRSVNDQSKNRNRGDIHDEFDDEWQDPLAWTVKQVVELKKADLRRNKGEQYAVIVQDQTEADETSNNSTNWFGRIFKTFFSSDDSVEESKEIGPKIKTFKCYFPDGPDQCLPIIHTTMAKNEENLKSNPEALERIDRITTFSIKSEDVDCVVNDSVYVDFQNRENFENGIITQKIASSSPPGDEQTSPSSAFKKGSRRPCIIKAGTEMELSKSPKRNVVAENFDQGRVEKDVAEYKEQFGVGEEVTPDFRTYQVREWMGKGSNDTEIEVHLHSGGKTGAHGQGLAIDIPVPHGSQIGDTIAKFWEDKGYAVIWRAREHWGHVHVEFKKGAKSKGERVENVQDVNVSKSASIPSDLTKNIC